MSEQVRVLANVTCYVQGITQPRDFRFLWITPTDEGEFQFNNNGPVGVFTINSSAATVNFEAGIPGGTADPGFSHWEFSSNVQFRGEDITYALGEFTLTSASVPETYVRAVFKY